MSYIDWYKAAKNLISLKDLTYDAHRFVMYHQLAIEMHPLQLYASVLLFSPTQSLIRKLSQDQEPGLFTIKPALSDRWGACLQTLTIDEDYQIEFVAYSPDSRFLACATKKAVSIYDASSGACLEVLEHPNSDTGLAFSCESLLATTSNDNLVHIWDPASGECLKVLEGHNGAITYVASSRNQLASASKDGTIKIWDTSNSVCLRTLVGHKRTVTLVAFSPNLLASLSLDMTIKIWDVNSDACLLTFESDGYLSRSLALSPDSTKLASTYDMYVKIWDPNNGACLQKLRGHKDTVNSVTFAHDATWIASASVDRTVKIWSLRHGTCLQTFADHSYGVSSVALSHDSVLLASASWDGTVKIWDTSNVEVCAKEPEGHSKAVLDLVFLRDSTWLASLSRDQTVRIWDSNSGTCLQTLEDFESDLTHVGSCNTTTLAIGMWNKCIEIWDTDNSIVSYSRKLRIPSDGSHAGFTYVSLSHDSTRLVAGVGMTAGDISIFDISGSSVSCLGTIERAHDWPYVTNLTLSHDSSKLASASSATISIWDLDSGVRLHTLTADRRVANIAFDATDSYLHIGHSTISTFPPYAVDSLDKPEHPLYPSGGYSLDIDWITYGGKNVLWVPRAYQSIRQNECISVCGRRVAVGTEWGKVWIVNFNPHSSDELDSRNPRKRLRMH
jgi:WD40 repeat protein